MQCRATITASAVIPCCSSTIVNSCFRPALFSVKVWAPLCLGSHPAEETFISTGLCFIHHRRCCFCWHRDLARSARAHTMLRAAGNVQKNNTKMLIRVMCNMGRVQLPYYLSWYLWEHLWQKQSWRYSLGTSSKATVYIFYQCRFPTVRQIICSP